MKYTLVVRKTCIEVAHYEVEAESQAAAEAMADKLVDDPDFPPSDNSIDFDTVTDEVEITDVYPTEATTDATDTRPA